MFSYHFQHVRVRLPTSLRLLSDLWQGRGFCSQKNSRSLYLKVFGSSLIAVSTSFRDELRNKYVNAVMWLRRYEITDACLPLLMQHRHFMT